MTMMAELYLIVQIKYIVKLLTHIKASMMITLRFKASKKIENIFFDA